jgi:hypothetical protein
MLWNEGGWLHDDPENGWCAQVSTSCCVGGCIQEHWDDPGLRPSSYSALSGNFDRFTWGFLGGANCRSDADATINFCKGECHDW